jgi:hypothetical protein
MTKTGETCNKREIFGQQKKKKSNFQKHKKKKSEVPLSLV